MQVAGTRAALALLLCELAAGGLSWSRNAQACLWPVPAEFSIDPALAGLDLDPPGAPRGVSAVASRSSGTFCKGNQCTANTCGNHVDLRLEFEPAADDRSAPGDLGYRLRFRDGVVPPELEQPLRRVLTGTPPLSVQLPEGFDAVVALDASFELVALDRAGNESPGSEPFRLAFNACTLVVGLDGCAEDSGERVTCSSAGCVEAASDSDSGCSLEPSRAAPGGRVMSLLGIGLVGCALLRRRRRVEARTKP
ncbi:MAG: hypothetical protein ABI895_17285 [Deltaproteobacteria bacterium]